MNTRSNGTESRRAFDALSGPADTVDRAHVEGYHLRELLRRTPTHDVFLATHYATGVPCELVVVRRFADVDQSALRQTIESEVYAARALSHPGIASIENVGVLRDGRLYIATARPNGCSLREILAREGCLSRSRTLDLGHALVTAVAAAHERGVTHGRLTPDNIVVSQSNSGWPERLVVLGFGTAAAQGGGLAPGSLPEDPSPYMSPERSAGHPPSSE